MIKEFKEFIQRGNAMHMAVAFILGAAFTAIVKSLVDDIIMPILGVFTNGLSFENMFITLDGNNYSTLAEAKEAGGAVIAYGNFINAIISFVLVSFVIFMLVRQFNKINKKEEVVEEITTKTCEFCKSEIALNATRCPYCTTQLS